MYSGKILAEDNRSLFDYAIKNDSTIILSTRNRNFHEMNFQEAKTLIEKVIRGINEKTAIEEMRIEFMYLPIDTKMDTKEFVLK